MNKEVIGHFYDDGISDEYADFESVVYKTPDELHKDLYWLGRNAYYSVGGMCGTALKIPRPTQEISHILQKQSEAKQRLRVHKRGSMD